MTQILIDVSELEQLGVQMLHAKPVVEREFLTAMTRSTATVQHDAQVEVVWDTATLRRSITSEVTPFYGAVGSNLVYAPVVEYGMEPGTWIPRGAIAEWMRRHDILPEAEFVIRRAIHDRGLPARPYLEPALQHNLPKIYREFDLAAGRAVATVIGAGAGLFPR